MSTRVTIQQRHQEELDQLKEIIEIEDIDGYGGEVDGDKFLLWASKQHLQFLNDPPTTEDLLERKTDGRDDIGLDLYYVDDDEEVVYLVQSKYRSQSDTIKRQEMDSFLRLPEKLLDRAVLGSISNTGVLQFAYDYKELLSKGFELRLVYLTTERPTPQIRSAVEAWNGTELSTPSGQYIAHRAEIVGAEELMNAYPETFEVTTTRVTFTDWYMATMPISNLRYLNGTIKADELVRVFNQHKFKIFQLNPRGPLGATNVNKEIRRTLKNDEERSRFYFLNNGLTAVCESFSMDENGGLARIQGLQIVNGCQTTWNIYQHAIRGGSLDGASVNIKLIEVQAQADTLAGSISRASNSQSQMKDWDFLFNESEQIDLQRQFELLSDKSIFYELKRGEQKFIRGVTTRKTTIKDVAQAMWAFVGHPSEAKDRLREIPRSYKVQDSSYRSVFFEGVTARHLILPLEIHDRVKKKWRETESQAQGSQNYQNAGDARLHFVWLIGHIIIRATQVEGYKNLDVEALRHVNNRIDQWFTDAYSLAKDAVDDTVDYYTRDDAPERVTLRQVFRSTNYYGRFLTELDRVLRGRFDALQLKITGGTSSVDSGDQLRFR